jgi:hypothetical protein
VIVYGGVPVPLSSWLFKTVPMPQAEGLWHEPTLFDLL